MKIFSTSLTITIGTIAVVTTAARLHLPHVHETKNTDSNNFIDAHEAGVLYRSGTNVGEATEPGAAGNDDAFKALVHFGTRNLRNCWSGDLTPAWHPTYDVGWSRGYCRFTVDCDSPSYPSQLKCCQIAYAGQVSGHCLTTLPNPPTSSPVDADGGLPIYYPNYDENWSDGYCVNTLPMPSGRPTFASELECCKRAYGGQISGKSLLRCFSSMMAQIHKTNLGTICSQS